MAKRVFEGRPNTYWVVDCYRQKRFGPISNKKLAEKIKTQAKKTSDLGLEISSNVGIVLVPDPDMDWEFQAYAVGQFHVNNGKVQIVES